MNVTEAWAVLGLAPTDEAREVKRAYGRLLKQIDVDGDPSAFIRLREAYELALAWGSAIPEWEREEPAGEGEDALPAAEAEAAELWPQTGADDGGGPEVTFGPDESWRPEPPAGAERLPSVCRELDGLLFGTGPVDERRLAELGEQLFALCDAAPVDEAAGTEHWLMSALAASIPRSDPLIEPAMHHFGWDRAVPPRDYGLAFDLDALQQRRADRALLDRLRRFADVGERRALEELELGGRTRLGLFELGLARDVRRFLDNMLAAHPTIAHDLDQAALTWWRGYFSRWHLPDTFWFQLLGIPAVLTVGGAVALAAAEIVPPVSILPGFLLATLATLLGILAWSGLQAWAAARNRADSFSFDQGSRAVPWLLASLALPPAAIGLAFEPWTAPVCAGAALVVAAGVFLTTRAPIDDTDSGSMLGPPSVPAIAIVASLIVLFVIPDLALHLVGPFAALCYVGYRGHEAAAIRLEAMSRAGNRAILAVAGSLAAAMIVLILRSMPALPPPPVLALVPAAAAAQHLATSSAFLITARLEWAIRVAALLFYFTAGRNSVRLPAFPAGRLDPALRLGLQPCPGGGGRARPSRRGDARRLLELRPSAEPRCALAPLPHWRDKQGRGQSVAAALPDPRRRRERGRPGGRRWRRSRRGASPAWLRRRRQKRRRPRHGSRRWISSAASPCAASC